MPFEFDMIWFSVAILCALTLIPIVYLIISRRPELSAGQAARYAQSSKLPFGTEENHARVRERLSRRGRASMWGVLIALLVWSPFVLWGASWGGSPLFLWLITLSIMIGVLTVSSVIETVREQLRQPRTDIPRVAHSRQLATRDYLQPWRRVLAPVALIAAAATVAAVLAWRIAAPDRIATDTVLWCGGFLVFAVSVFVVTRVMERIVLAKPQLASDDLQLAWNDLFRADTLWTLRSAATMAAALPLGMAAATLTLTPIAVRPPELSTLMSTWTPLLICAAQVTYSFGLGKMAASRYPAALRPQDQRSTGLSVALAQGDGA
ncbi:MAG: hypothetical protein BGO47_13095 [Microbacterium sp. 67-17]|uniref:hypothetical protein n=1 Tax=Microbacterium sp. 67-17 TaxID=1895782 RepID=UPI0009591603|nr:hypothetical protein [Microbacterium sp. 67-17]OJW01401.1 MAG: hypothetical protein BGO47_13095 [Microbacterium sp. 67-17]